MITILPQDFVDLKFGRVQLTDSSPLCRYQLTSVGCILLVGGLVWRVQDSFRPIRYAFMRRAERLSPAGTVYQSTNPWLFQHEGFSAVTFHTQQLGLPEKVFQETQKETKGYYSWPNLGRPITSHLLHSTSQASPEDQATCKGRRLKCCLLMKELMENFVAIYSPSQLLWIASSSYCISCHIKNIGIFQKKKVSVAPAVRDTQKEGADTSWERRKSCSCRRGREKAWQDTTDGTEFKAHAVHLFLYGF